MKSHLNAFLSKSAIKRFRVSELSGGSPAVTQRRNLPIKKFKLVEGSGPVHLVGNYIQGVSEDLLSTKDSCCEDEESEEAPFNILKPKRPPAVSTDEPKSKKAKVEEEKDEDESEQQSDEEMEVEIKAPVSAANVKSKQPQAKPAVKENAKISEKVDDDEAEE